VAQEIAGFSRRLPDKKVYAVGFSIGGQIVLEAAAMSAGKIEKVVVLSGIVGFPDTFGAGFRAISWVLSRAWSTVTTDFALIWKDFYKVLLFGEAGVTDAGLSQRSKEIIKARRDKIVTPTPSLVCSHMRDATFRAAVNPARVGDTSVLFFHGQLDIVSPVDRVSEYARQFRTARVESLEWQGHQIFLTEPTLFERIGDFFSN
jgi:pimeloyl-ACP methyl ester carboxylesterase